MLDLYLHTSSKGPASLTRWDIGVVECLLKFACLRILHTHTHTHAHPSVSPYLFISALPPRFCLATLVAKNPRVVRPPNFLSSHLTLFRLSARHRGPLWLSFIRRDYSRSSSLLLTCKSSKVMHTQVRCA